MSEKTFASAIFMVIFLAALTANAFKVLTGKSGYGRLDVALSKKQSRVSTLTAAQLSD